MNNLIDRLAKRVYALPQCGIFATYDKAVVIDYAGDIRNNNVWLPDAEIKSLQEAAQLVAFGDALDIIWVNTSGKRYPLPQLLDSRKIEVVKKEGIVLTTARKSLTCTNTITEAEAIIQAHPYMRRVILVGDWRHLPRTVAIWKKLFKGDIAWVAVDGKWNDSKHPSPFVRSDMRFLIMNLAHHALFKIFGIRLLRRLKQAEE